MSKDRKHTDIMYIIDYVETLKENVDKVPWGVTPRVAALAGRQAGPADGG
jgi:hypothetical protein